MTWVGVAFAAVLIVALCAAVAHLRDRLIQTRHERDFFRDMAEHRHQQRNDARRELARLRTAAQGVIAGAMIDAHPYDGSQKVWAEHYVAVEMEPLKALVTIIAVTPREFGLAELRAKEGLI